MRNQPSAPTVLALGNFDGLHLGHLSVLATAKRVAAKLQTVPTVLLFDRHPKTVLTGVCPPMLLTPEDKLRRLRDLGFAVEIVSFETLQSKSPEAFFHLLQHTYHVRAICCGQNYHFGSRASGSVETLKRLCAQAGVDLHAVGETLFDGLPISSTRIRRALEEGKVEDANKMLGRSFSYCLEVVSGDKRGRLLGFPTINQFFPADFVRVQRGVYASKVRLKDVWYPAVTNIGVRPTIGTDSFRSETHLLGFSGNLYGQYVEVHLLHYMREEKKCKDLEELKQTIQNDAAAASAAFEEQKMNNQLQVKAVFFDFDDTLQSRKGAYRLYCEAFLDKYFPGISAEERMQKLDEMEAHVDGGYKDREVYFPEMIALWGWNDHPPLQELYDSFNYDFGKYIVMLPGAVDVLREVKNRGYILGAITNGVSSLQNMKLDTAGIRDLFDVVVVSGDIGIYKPDRRIFDEAIRRAGVKNEEALFVGDHPINDIDGALGADMQVIRMNYGDFKGKGLGKATVAEIEDIREVLNYI